MTSTRQSFRMPREWREELDASGLPWRLERRSKHFALRIDGLVASVVPMNLRTKRGHNLDNTLATIRRFIKARKAG